MEAGLSTKNAPSPSVVLPHYAYGAVAFIAAAIIMYFASGDIASSYMTPKVLSITHVMILGWITMIIFGALQQMLPVLAGAVFKKPLVFANIIHISLTIGTRSPRRIYSQYNSKSNK